MCYKIPFGALKEQGWTPAKVSKEKLDSCSIYCLDEQLPEILMQKYVVIEFLS